MNVHRSLLLLQVTVCSLLPVHQARAETRDQMCVIADAAVEDASKIRGLKIKEKVPCLVHDRSEVEDFIRKTIDEQIPSEKLAMEELIYKALGFIPESFDYKNGIVELYLSQLGGYYDPEQNHFVMASWMPALLQTTIAVHELTHALQDQYFDLAKFIDVKRYTSDELLARSALAEGDATAVMIDYSRKIMGQQSIATETNVQSFMLQNLIGASVMAQLAGVPDSLQLMLLFPYTSGLRFAHARLLEDGYAGIDSCFRRPPRSTEEILHPEKYQQKEPDFTVVSDRVLRGSLDPSMRILHSDRLGEFSISALLSMGETDREKVAEAANGWGGDRVGIIESADGTETIVRWVTLWDTETDAKEFLNQMKMMLAKRLEQDAMSTDTPVMRDGVEYLLSGDGKQVIYQYKRSAPAANPST